MSERSRSKQSKESTAAASAQTANTPDLTDQAQGAVDQVQEQAGQLADQARGAAMTQLSTQKDRLAGGLETAAGLLRGAGEQLRALDQPTFAKYVDRAAERAQEFSEELQTQNLGQLLQTTERFARRQPGLFAGSALTLGFLATRFFRSSEQQQEGGETDRYRRDTTGGYAPYGAAAPASQTAGYGSETAAYGSETTGYETTTGTDYAAGLDDPLLDASLDDSRAAAGYPPGSEQR